MTVPDQVSHPLEDEGPSEIAKLTSQLENIYQGIFHKSPSYGCDDPIKAIDFLAEKMSIAYSDADDLRDTIRLFDSALETTNLMAKIPDGKVIMESVSSCVDVFPETILKDVPKLDESFNLETIVQKATNEIEFLENELRSRNIDPDAPIMPLPTEQEFHKSLESQSTLLRRMEKFCDIYQKDLESCVEKFHTYVPASDDFDAEKQKIIAVAADRLEQQDQIFELLSELHEVSNKIKSIQAHFENGSDGMWTMKDGSSVNDILQCVVRINEAFSKMK